MITLYSGTETVFTHNGLGVLNNCISAVSSRSLNGRWILNITHALEGNYDLVEVGQIIKAPTPSGLQLFRIIKVEETLTKLNIYCNHIFYDLSNRIIKVDSLTGKPWGVASACLTNATSGTAFTVTTDGVGGTSKTLTGLTGKDIVSAFMGGEGSIVSFYGSEFDFDNFVITSKMSIGQDNGVLIAYRKNLTGLIETLDYSNLATRLYPISRDGYTLSSGGATSTSPYVDSGRINDYPLIYTKTLDCMDTQKEDGMTWDTFWDLLEQECINEFAKGVDIPYFVYKVDFVQLSATEEYKNYANLETINIGDTVTIRHEKLNKQLKSRVHNYVYDCLLEKFNSIELGNVTRRAGKTDANLQKKVITYDRRTTGYLDIQWKGIQALGQALGNYQTQIDGEGIIHNASTLGVSSKAWKLGDSGVLQKSTDGGLTWADIANGDLSIKGDFTCNNISINKDMYMFSDIYADTLVMDLYGTGAEDIGLKVGLPNRSNYINFNENEGNDIYGYTRVRNSLYVDGSCSAQSFIDRTPFYEDDALSDIEKIKGKDGEIDHTTLPEFVQVELEDGHLERDIGNMVSVLTRGIQQIIEKLANIEKRLLKLEETKNESEEK